MEYTLPIRTAAIHCAAWETLYSPEYMLLLPLSGEISLNGAEQSTVQPGTLLFLAPFSERKLILLPGSKALYAVITASWLEEMVGIPKRAAVVVQPDGTHTATEKLVELFDLQYNHQDAKPLHLTRIAVELLSALEPSITNEVQSETQQEYPNKQRVRQMAEYMEAHFREPFQLGDLADAFGVSRQYLSTMFHKEFSMPFSEYLLNLRLSEALRLLLTTDKTITDISETSGFPNLKSFNQAFKAKHEVSPKEFRQNRRTNASAQTDAPTPNVLHDVNQLLRPYRLVYQKNEEAIRITDLVDATQSTPYIHKWDILNVDNSAECLRSSAQESLRQMQNELHFRYVRLGNVVSSETIPFIPTTGEHRFSYFLRLLDFFRSIDLTPILYFGDSYQVMMDAVMTNDSAYSLSMEDWLHLLELLLKASVDYWGAEWVNTWRFEFHMPQRLYGDEDPERFIDLFEKSYALIHSYCPESQVGGPALSLDTLHAPRWNAWWDALEARKLPVDFISAELWADFTEKIDGFYGHYGEWQTIRRLESVQNADASLAVQKVHFLHDQMSQHGYQGTRLYISALGITKHQATAAQMGGHCAAHLVKCAMELSGLVDGIGCWKALNTEAEYPDEHRVFSSGCGLLSRYDLKNINWYAHSFFNGLHARLLSQGRNFLVTADGRGRYAILIHNCKNYTEYFYKHYLDEKGLDFTNPRHYASTVALEQTVTIEGAAPGKYLAEQFLIGDHHGCVAAVLLQMGQIGHSNHEISYLSGQSLPYQHAFSIEADDTLRFTVTLQANEVMLLRITPEHT